MSVIKGSDVNNLRSARFRNEIHTKKAEKAPVVTGLSQEEPSVRRAIPPVRVYDSHPEHSFSEVARTPNDPFTSSFAPQLSAVPKSARE